MKSTVAVVLAFQSGLIFIVAGISWALEGRGVAAAVTGGAAAIAGTVAYGICIVVFPARRGAQILRRHLLGEAAKIVVSISLLLPALGASDGETLSCIAGFSVALLAYPLAMLLVNGNTERH